MQVNKYRREIVTALKAGKTVRRRRSYADHPYTRWWGDDFYAYRAAIQQEYDEHVSGLFRDTKRLYKAPNWYMHHTVTVPERAAARRLAHKTLKLIDLEDAPVFPNGRLTRKGYW